MHDLASLLVRAADVALECAKGDTAVEAFIVAIPDAGKPSTLFLDKDEDDGEDDEDEVAVLVAKWFASTGASRWFSITTETIPTSDGDREVVVCTAEVDDERAQQVLMVARDGEGRIADLVDVTDMVDVAPWTFH